MQLTAKHQPSPFLFSYSFIFLISKSQIMKKTYLIPAMKAEEAQAVSMLAESLAIDSTTKVDGGDALARGDNNWDIWGE